MSVMSEAAIAASRDGVYCPGLSPDYRFEFGSLMVAEVWDSQISCLFEPGEVPKKRNRFSHGPCFVYAFRFQHIETSRVFFKIGITGNVDSRFSGMRGTTPPGFSSSVFRHGRCRSRKQAEQIERSILVSADIAGRWCHGEWILEGNG